MARVYSFIVMFALAAAVGVPAAYAEWSPSVVITDVRIEEPPKTWIFLTNIGCDYEDVERVNALIAETLEDDSWPYYPVRYEPYVGDLPYEAVCFPHAPLLNVPGIDDAVRKVYPDSPLIWLYDLTGDRIANGQYNVTETHATPDGNVSRNMTLTSYKEVYTNSDRMQFEALLRSWGASEDRIDHIEGISFIPDGSAIADYNGGNALSIVHEWTHVVTCKGHYAGTDYYPDLWVDWFGGEETRPWCVKA
jgi:hypothetical protein